MTDTFRITTIASGVRLEVRVITRSPRAGIEGVRDGRLLLRVNAPPVDDAANDAVVRTLAEALDLPKRSVRIVAGHHVRNKALEIDGLDSATVRARLAAAQSR